MACCAARGLRPLTRRGVRATYDKRSLLFRNEFLPEALFMWGRGCGPY